MSAIAAVAERYRRHQTETNWYLCMQAGLPVEEIRPVSEENAESNARFCRGILDDLKKIAFDSLDSDERLTYRALEFYARSEIGEQTYFWLQSQITPYSCPLLFLPLLFKQFRFEGPADAARYVRLLRDYARLVRSLLSFLQGQHARRIILPRAEIDAVSAMLHGYAGGLANFEREQAGSAAHDVITEDIRAAFGELIAFVDGAYRVGAPEAVGLAQYPGGEEYYAYLVKLRTTRDVRPEALHERGMEEVEKLEHALDGVRGEVSFDGDAAAFRRFLATDRRFFAETTKAYGERLERHVERAAANVSRFFSRMPKAPYGVAPLPKELAGSQTFGYYEPPTPEKPAGTYLYNAWNPEKTTTLSLASLILHELIPGHHFQICLQRENNALPAVRRYGFAEAGFVEGWAEYAAQLGFELGAYDDPYDRAGRFMQDMMVSVRLVVDTGMNTLGWSRERAVGFMREHLTLSDEQLATESLRYSTDIPAQALAYKTGETTILALRERCERALGDAFDLREFHAWVIGQGSMTLDALTEHVAMMSGLEDHLRDENADQNGE